MICYDCFILFSRNREGNNIYYNISLLNIGTFGAKYFAGRYICKKPAIQLNRKRKVLPMSTIAQLSPNSVAARPIDVNQASQTPQNTINVKSGEVAQKTARKSKTDTVVVSSQALKLSSRLDKVPQQKSK